MKSSMMRLQERLSHIKIKNQLTRIYVLAIVIPVLIIGSFLMVNTYRILDTYHYDMIESHNIRIKTILFELTTQIYNLSEQIALDPELQDILSNGLDLGWGQGPLDNWYNQLDTYVFNHVEISDLHIYLEADKAMDYERVRRVDDAISETEWYSKGRNQFGAFWHPFKVQDQYGTEYWQLALVRKIPLTNPDAVAVLVITISDNYLKNRLDSHDYLSFISLDNGIVFYSSDRLHQGMTQPVGIDYVTGYFSYVGPAIYNDQKHMSHVSNLKLYQTDNHLYVATLNQEAYKNLWMILAICLLIIIFALLVPGVIIRFFTLYFTGRVDTLRDEMHKASHDDYDLKGLIEGEDEISQAFIDLKIMVQKIKEKDARMYDAKIKEQNLINEQHVMEYKMLASQINPHFLYNTLETIRMKALTVGNKEVATAIKLLGKSMRYVLENSGASATTLFDELTYIETYLTIQKLRFQDKVNYELSVPDGMNLRDYQILPLLLQPIVENAILHGLEDVEVDGRIKIEVNRHGNDVLWIQISDNGVGMDSATLDALSKKLSTTNMNLKSSIGLYNIVQRIRLYYGERYGLKIKSKEGVGTTISLVLPLVNLQME